MKTHDETVLETPLEGQLLIAMPQMPDARFAKSVILMCAHSQEGAMGLIINKYARDLSLGQLLEHIDLDDDSIRLDDDATARPIHTGGPVEDSRGFVLHSPDYFSTSSTLAVTEEICLTASVDVLKAIAQGKGPERSILALGYAGWAGGQLEAEIGANGWLTCPADAQLVFEEAPDKKYSAALSRLGIDPTFLASTAGRA